MMVSHFLKTEAYFSNRRKRMVFHTTFIFKESYFLESICDDIYGEYSKPLNKSLSCAVE